ncbi:MAG: DUF4153 domain-containing protein [Bacteroidia bacterium]|nr:DUF4153 domain-containing protein [Bacteroidia bacterium]
MKINLPSLQQLIKEAGATLVRFPLVLACAVAGTYAVWELIDLSNENKDLQAMQMGHLLMVCALGLTVLTAFTLFSERRNHNNIVRWAIQLLWTAILIWYYVTLPDTFTIYEIFRYAIYVFAGHLLVAFLPYSGINEPEGFWQYNKSIFLRILTSVLYTGVLTIGLCIALLAVDQLFDIEVKGEYYAKIIFTMMGIFNTWFFLSGVPKQLEQLQMETAYPKGLKVFTQFVLLPLITLYMVILYVYMGKIIITGVWPEGWVSWLVMCFAVAGILALLLIWPIRNDEGNKWIGFYSKSFYFAIFPLVILLFASIRLRISEYGFTEPRYYVLLLACWLALIAAYFLISKKKSVKVIPMSLFVIAILSVHGPWSAFQISKKSQLNRFETLLEKNQLLENNMVVKAVDTIPKTDNLQICETIDYMNEYHGYKEFQPYFSQQLDSVMKPDTVGAYVSENDRIIKLIGLEWVHEYMLKNESEKYFYANLYDNVVIPVAGYDAFRNVDFFMYDTDVKEQVRDFSFGEDSVKFVYNNKKHQIIISHLNDSTTINIIDFVNRMESKRSSNSTYPVTEMTLNASLPDVRIKLVVKSISGKKVKDQLNINAMNADFFVKFEKTTLQ